MAKLAEDLPGHQHCPGGDGPDFGWSTSTHPSQHHVLHQEQLPGSPAGRQCPAVQGSHRESSERVFSWVLQPAVPGAEEDMGSASSHRFVYFESAPGGAALHDGDSGVRSRRRQERMDCLHRHKRSLWRQKVLTIQGQQEDLPIHLSTLRIGNFTSRIYQASKASRSLVEAARCRATRLLLADPCRVTKTGPTACRDDHHSFPAARMGHQFREVGPNTQPGLPIPWNAVQHSTVHIGAPAENASQDPVGSSALDEEPCHHSPRSAQVAGHGGVYGTTCTSWKVAPLTSPVVGHHSMMPEDRELVRQDHSSSVGSTGGGLVGISSSPARSFSRHPGNGSHFLQGCVQLGLGSPTRLMLNTGTVVCISKIVAHTHSGDAGHHQAPEWISVPGIAQGSSSTGIEPSRTSWEAIYGSWRLLKRLTHKQTETMKIESQPMKSECCQDYGLTTVR